MTKKLKLKGFTLLEMLIVMIIIGILAVVLTESYITISKTALRIEQEKNISEESLILTQVIQSISDEATIDYDKYNAGELKKKKGYSNILYLKGGKWDGTSIYTDGECLELEGNFLLNDDGSIKTDKDGNIPDIQKFKDCKLILKDGDQNETILNTSGKVVISKATFRIIPYDSDKNYFNSEDVDVINQVHQPAFWMFIHLYSPLYQPQGINNVHQPLQLFFNLNL